MASLFEQYEQAAAISAGYMPGRPLVPEMRTAGLINAKLEDDGPIFCKQRIDFSVPDSITHLVVSNNQLALAMKNKICRIDLKHHCDMHDTDLTRLYGQKTRVYDMFLDLSGKHLLISLVMGDNQTPLENVYFFQTSQKPQVVSKMKGHIISAVAWNYENTNENTTSNILVGTTKGLIFETELASGDERHFFQSSPEQHWKQVFDINTKHLIETFNTGIGNGIITGLLFQRVSGSTYFVLATTPSLLIRFMGNSSSSEPPILQGVFSNYKDIPVGFIQLPGKLEYSKLQLFWSSSTKPSYPPQNTLPTSLAWMTEPGVLFGYLNYKDMTPENLIRESKLLAYPEDKGGHKDPLSIVLTEFHVLILFRDRLKVLSVLNEELVFEDVFTEMYGPLRGLAKDPIYGTIWAFSEMAIYRYKVVREDRNVWEICLRRGEYDLAKEYCKNDPVKLDKVLSQQADDLFQKKQYEESAELYAQTHNSFEEIALKFLQSEQDSALRVFLLKKLTSLKSQDKTQITMIVLWLFEIYLNQLGVMRNAGKQNTQAYAELKLEFHGLLNLDRVKECVINNRGAVYNLMTGHGDEENLTYFTEKMKDFERVIQYHLQHENYVEALAVLTKQSKAELFYKFSPTLMQAIPEKTVDAWIAQDRRLNPAKLIPALVLYDSTRDPRQGNEAIRYLEHCVHRMGTQDPAIHNYLLALYARLQPKVLMTYLQSQGQEEGSVPYDQEYALRLCSELGLDEACVHIYTTMGLYEEAVDLALKVDVELGKQNADRPEDNEDLKKKLWLKIAKHVVQEGNDIKRAMEFLQECDLIKIEDILPFFPDFVTIDHFKDAICSSLQEYNQNIEGLKEEMEEATESAQEIRTEIQTFRNKFSMVRVHQKCSCCGYPIMTRSFYLFPCQHMFHSDCIVNEVLPHLSPTKRDRVDEIQRLLAAISGKEDSVSISSASLMSSVVSTKDKLCAELDDLVASDCLYCGDLMIESVDDPFINPDHYVEIMKSWE